MKRSLTGLAIIFISTVAIATTSQPITLGQTYDVVEPDALAQIETRAKEIDWKSVADKVDPFRSIKPVELPTAKVARIRHHIPWYVTEFDVTDKDGNTIYPQGFRFNPLEYSHLTHRVVVGTPAQLERLKDSLRYDDTLIITQGDVRDATKAMGRPVFILDPTVKERLDLQYVPSIVEQQGNTLKISELEPDSINQSTPDLPSGEKL